MNTEIGTQPSHQIDIVYTVELQYKMFNVEGIFVWFLD